MSRPIGTRIIQACRQIAAHGPIGYHAVCKIMPQENIANVEKYCTLAVKLGLLSVDRKFFPMRYSVVAGWEDRLNARPHKPRPKKEKAIMQKPAYQLPNIPRVASVWDLGALV